MAGKTLILLASISTLNIDALFYTRSSHSSIDDMRGKHDTLNQQPKTFRNDCGENEVYTNCMSPCKLRHCKHLKQSSICDPNIKCQPGCECIQNFFRNSDNVCMSSEICEEYDSQFDPEKDIDIILNEGNDDEATNEDQDFYNIVTSKDGLIKETESDSKMRSNTEDVENKDHDTEDYNINEIEGYQSFNAELINGDWVVEQTEHNDTNQEPNTDQKLSPEEEIKNVDDNENVEQNKHNYVINAPLPTFSSNQQKLSDEKSEVDTDGSTQRQDVQAPENKVETTTEMKFQPEEIESNRTEPNHVIIDDKIGKTNVDRNVDETLETTTLPEKNELPIRRPVTEVYPEDEKNTNQWREPPKPWHDEKPNKTRPELNTDQSQESSNMPESNGWPSRRPETEVYPEDKKDTNQWRVPNRPWNDEQPNKTRPELNTDESQESSNVPEKNEWPNRRPGTEVYPGDRDNTNQWREPSRPWHDEQPYTTSRPEHSTKPWHPYPPRKWYGSHRYKRPRCRNNLITIIYPIPVVEINSNQRPAYPNSKPKYTRKHGHAHKPNRKYEHDHKRGYEHERNLKPESRRENEYDRKHEPDRRLENGYERNREPENRRENGNERDREPESKREDEYGHGRSSHGRSRTWCRSYPGDKRRPCPWYKTKPWYRPKHDSHPDYKNKEHNSHRDRSYRPKRVCRRERNGKTICYVPKSYARNS